MQKDKLSLVQQIRLDYERRYQERRALETQWKLNAHFVAGNQYCVASGSGTIIQQDKARFWEERLTFNHIATILETRLAKLSRVKPKLSVSPVAGEESDVSSAKVSDKILDAACHRINLSRIISDATVWSELTGTVFYKISWDKSRGMSVGKIGDKRIKEGDVRVDVCPPYEIFPDSIYNGSVEQCNSIIHAKVMPVSDVKATWGKSVMPDSEERDEYLVLRGLFPEPGGELKSDHVLVLERFTRPCEQYPLGRYEVVACDELLHEGDLPYANGEDGERDLPFIRQCSTVSPGGFYGVSPIERAIPIQRAYNAVKNRKHEFMNRIASGVLAVEDGSVDTDDLEDEGLEPGKILVYRQGSTPPEFIGPGEIPEDFTAEEERLMDEFARVSGISEIMRTSTVPSTVTSGTALEMLLEQDNTRLSVSAEQITEAAKAIGAHMLRLYKQFADQNRLSRYVGESGAVELFCWNNSALGSDDVIIEASSEIGDSAASRRSQMLELYRAGLLTDENGKLSTRARHCLLQAFGYANMDIATNLEQLQERRAASENAALGKQALCVKSYDDHAIHVARHTAFVLSNQLSEELEQEICEHITAHKTAMKQEEK